MLTAYVLVILTTAGSDYRPVVVSFYDKKSCEAAAEIVTAASTHTRSSPYLQALCVPTGK